METFSRLLSEAGMDVAQDLSHCRETQPMHSSVDEALETDHCATVYTILLRLYSSGP
jgi:hypothetical protein